MPHSTLELDAAGWTTVDSLLKEHAGSASIAANIIRHLQQLGAVSAIFESEYLDRDFTDAYSAYYSKLFKRHSKICRRILFFSSDIRKPLRKRTYADRVRALEKLGKTSYLGFIVLRAVQGAPIAQVVLRAPPSPAGLETHLLVKSEIHAHSLGATFSIDGIPMTQQDQRIGACAQASIWTCVRHFYYRHRGPWMSMVGVNSAAMARASLDLNRTIPSGSEYLTLHEMISALEAAGRKAFYYLRDTQVNGVNYWQSVRPVDVINRYVDSGIPVIVLLGGQIGHAVVASGQVFQSNVRSSPLPLKPTRAEFCESFLVNDDQRGPNLRMPISAASPTGETGYDISGAVCLLIGLPDKVFMPAEKAEELAWDFLSKYTAGWGTYKNLLAARLGASAILGDDFVAKSSSNQVLARTYLTYGWKYKARALRNLLPEAAKQAIQETELPRYVWVTEFGTVDSFGAVDPHDRRIFAHCVIDATAKNMDNESRLIFHAPGHLYRQRPDPKDPITSNRELFTIRDDVAYFPKRRGHIDVV